MNISKDHSMQSSQLDNNKYLSTGDELSPVSVGGIPFVKNSSKKLSNHVRMYESKYLITQNDSKNTSIDILNYYCLIHIFQFLKIDDRTRIERVCKRWKTVIQESWCTIKQLDEYTWTCICGPKYSCEVTQSMLRIVLQKCGRYLTQIDLSIIDRHDLPTFTLADIINLCSNLTSIKTGIYEVSKTDLVLLQRKYKNITELEFGQFKSCVTDKHLENFFKIHKNLKFLSIHNYHISGKCLMHLPVKTMRTLQIRQCYVIDFEFSAALARLENLEYLKIYCCFIIGKKTTINTINNCKNLRGINIVDYCESNIDMAIRFNNIVNLQELTISCASLVDNDIIDMRRYCSQIIYLDISGCYNVSDNGLKIIATLPKLKYLLINYLPSISDIGLQFLKNLRRLECSGCSFITDEGIINVIKSSPELNFLAVVCCRGITDVTYDNARQICDRRKIVLHMDIDERNLRNDLISPFLKICSWK